MAFISLLYLQIHAAAFATVCFFYVLVWEDQGLPQYSPCVLWARGAWRSSCHTVAHSTCPLICADLYDLSADYLYCSISALWNVSTNRSVLNQNQQSKASMIYLELLFKYVSHLCCSFWIRIVLHNYFIFSVTWMFVAYSCASWPEFLRSFEPTSRGFWGNAFLCFIGNRCREEYFFFSLSWTFWSV